MTSTLGKILAVLLSIVGCIIGVAVLVRVVFTWGDGRTRVLKPLVFGIGILVSSFFSLMYTIENARSDKASDDDAPSI